MDILEVIANCDDGVYAVDSKQRIILWTENAQRILGYSTQETLGQFCYDLIAGRDDENNLICHLGCVAMDSAISSGRAPSHYCVLRNKQGKSVWVHMTHLVIPSVDKDLEAVVHMFRDVTEFAEARQLVEKLLPHVTETSLRVEMLRKTAVEPEYAPGHSPRELEVLSLLTEGNGPIAIADKLVISTTTARNHVQHILVKLGVHSALEAVVHAQRCNLL